MWETAVKKHEKEISSRAKKEAADQTAQKLIEKGLDNAFIRDITGLSIKEIQGLRLQRK